MDHERVVHRAVEGHLVAFLYTGDQKDIGNPTLAIPHRAVTIEVSHPVCGGLSCLRVDPEGRVNLANVLEQLGIRDDVDR